MIDCTLPRITLDGVELHAIDETTCVAHLMSKLANGEGGWVVTPNLDHLCRASRDDEFARMLSAADVAVADGMPLIWASKVQGTALPQRVAGSSLVWRVAEAAAKENRSLYLLGGDPGAADEAAGILREKYPGLRIAGTYCPPFGFEKDPAEIEKIRSGLTAATPDVVYVGLGSPKQEKLIELLKADYPATWWLGVGISLSFMAGRVKRAPRWVQKVGMEWLHRLCQEPKRLAKRYLLDDLPYVFRLLCNASIRRFSKNASLSKPAADGEKADCNARQFERGQ